MQTAHYQSINETTIYHPQRYSVRMPDGSLWHGTDKVTVFNSREASTLARILKAETVPAE